MSERDHQRGSIAPIESDLLVIGGGAAGLLAATAAADTGASVALVAGGAGATAFGTGCVDILGYIPPTAPENEGYERGVEAHPPLEPMAPLEKRMEALIARYPDHPYARLAATGKEEPRSALEAALELFRTAMRDAGYTADAWAYTGDADSIQWLPTPLGTWRPTALAPRYLAAGGADRPLKGTLLIGVEGYRKYSAPYVAGCLAATRRQLVPPMVYQHLGAAEVTASIASATVTLEPLVRSLNPHWREIDIALLDETHFHNFCARCAARVAYHGAERMGIPSVFGPKRYAERMAALEEAVECELFEIALPLSGAGERFQQALLAAAKATGVQIIDGYRARRALIDADGRCSGVVIGSNLAQRECRAAAIVIATGDIVTRGAVWDGDRWREPLFSLPLMGGYDNLDGATATDPHGPFPLSGHPVHRLGVRVDTMLRPVSGTGELCHPNIFVAGALLGGYDYAHEKSGLGVALATGYRAGENAVEVV